MGQAGSRHRAAGGSHCTLHTASTLDRRQAAHGACDEKWQPRPEQLASASGGQDPRSAHEPRLSGGWQARQAVFWRSLARWRELLALWARQVSPGGCIGWSALRARGPGGRRPTRRLVPRPPVQRSSGVQLQQQPWQRTSLRSCRSWRPWPRCCTTARWVLPPPLPPASCAWVCRLGRSLLSQPLLPAAAACALIPRLSRCVSSRPASARVPPLLPSRCPRNVLRLSRCCACLPPQPSMCRTARCGRQCSFLSPAAAPLLSSFSNAAAGQWLAPQTEALLLLMAPQGGVATCHASLVLPLPAAALPALATVPAPVIFVFIFVPCRPSWTAHPRPTPSCWPPAA